MIGGSPFKNKREGGERDTWRNLGFWFFNIQDFKMTAIPGLNVSAVILVNRQSEILLAVLETPLLRLPKRAKSKVHMKELEHLLTIFQLQCVQFFTRFKSYIKREKSYWGQKSRASCFNSFHSLVFFPFMSFIITSQSLIQSWINRWVYWILWTELDKGTGILNDANSILQLAFRELAVLQSKCLNKV